MSESKSRLLVWGGGLAILFLAPLALAQSNVDVATIGVNTIQVIHEKIDELSKRLERLERGSQNAAAGPKFTFVQLLDDAAGHAKGWDPGLKNAFYIPEYAIKDKSVIQYSIAKANPHPCWISSFKPEKGFELHCEKIVDENAVLNYVIMTP